MIKSEAFQDITCASPLQKATLFSPPRDKRMQLEILKVPFSLEVL